MMLIAPGVQILISELEFSFSRSSGPGGQNVNKVNSKATLRFNVISSPSLSEEQRALILEKLHTKVTTSGDILVSSDQFRDQIQNKDACMQRLGELLRTAVIKPKRRKKTKPSRSSVMRGKNSKRLHSEKKRSRSDRD